jgi:hypothetical protein
MSFTAIRHNRGKLMVAIAAACLLGTLWFAAQAFGQDDPDVGAQ